MSRDPVSHVTPLVDRVRAGPWTWGVTAQLFTAQLLMAAVGLFVNVAAARSMGPSGRGSLAVFLQLSYILATLCVAGLNRSYPAAVETRPSLGTALLDQRRLLLVPIATIATLSLLVGLTPIAEGPAPLLAGLAMALTVAGVVVWNALRTAAVAAGTARVFFLLVVVGQSVLLLSSALYLITGVESAAAWLTAYGVAHTAPPLVAWLVFGRRRTPVPSPARVTDTARRIGLRLLPSTLANIAMLRIDRLILPALAGVRQLGLYVVVAAITELIAWPLQSYADARIPHWRAGLLTGGLRPARLLAAGGLFSIGAALAVIVAGQWLLVPMFGSAYEASLPLVIPLALAAAAYAVSRVGHGLAVAAQLSGWVTAIDATGMTVAVAAYVLLIPSSGAAGAAWACLVGYGAAMLVSLPVVTILRRSAVAVSR